MFCDVFCPVSIEGNGPVDLRLGNLRLTVTAVVVSFSLAPKSGVDVHDEVLLNPVNSII